MRSNQEIMDVLDQLKKEHNLSLSEIARRTGMAKSAILRYFRRERELPLNRIEEFAKAFNVTPEYLLGVQPTNDSEFIQACLNLNDNNRETVFKLVKELIQKQ